MIVLRKTPGEEGDISRLIWPGRTARVSVLPLFTWRRKKIQLPKRSNFIKIQTIDNIQKNDITDYLTVCLSIKNESTKMQSSLFNIMDTNVKNSWKRSFQTLVFFREERILERKPCTVKCLTDCDVIIYCTICSLIDCYRDSCVGLKWNKMRSDFRQMVPHDTWRLIL
jgi:hypothetical protein